MPPRNFRVICFLAFAALANAALADHPNIARGFDVGKPYQMNGIDNINLFNGNLTVTLPIGQRYHVNGGLSYGLTLVYSGNVWDTVSLESLPCLGPTQHITRTYPSRRSNAGIGWLLSLGRLFPRITYPIQDSLYWQYETPDGAVHSFHQGLHDNPSPFVADPTISYTRDGTYLRMTVEANDRKVEFPDGTWQVFKELDTSTWLPTTGSSQSPEWRLTEIHDRFGNIVTVDYSTTADDPEIWTIRDGTRTQTVYFADASSTAQYASPYDLVLDKVVLSVLNGNTAEWRPAYAWRTIWPGGSNQGCDLLQHSWSNVPLLISLTLPPINNVSQVYSMVGPDGAPDYYINTSTDLLNAHLTGLQLPTGGWLEWDYLNFGYYAGSAGRIGRTAAVKTRRMVGADRMTKATWTYERSSSGTLSCTAGAPNPGSYNERPEQLVVSVTSPEGVTSVHYFSTYEDSVSECASPSTFNEDDYALPFTHGVSQGGPNGTTLYLSSETYSSPPTSIGTVNPTNLGYRVPGGTRVRSEWVTYSYDAVPDGPDHDRNARETAHATYFEDDPNCGGQTCYSSVTRYGFDGAGHFRQSSTGGNFPVDSASHGNHKTSFTKYPDLNITGTWLLNQYTERCAADETSERTAEIAQCSSLGTGALISQSCFDSTTGFLKRTRGLSGTAPSAADVLAIYTPLNGNVSQEDYYGGDTQTLPDQGTDLCSVTLPTSPQYTIANTYLYGSLETSRYRPTNSHSADPVFYSVKNTSIDANTGLVKTSLDAADLSTTYDYDVLGRIKQVAAPGEAAVNYAYTEATSTAPAKATVTKTSTAAGRVEATTVFDDFGRVSKEQRVLPAGTATRETDYTGSGWTQQVSEWEATPAHFTVFSNFDSFGRARKIRNPGQTETTATTIDYLGTRQIARTVNLGETLSGGTVQQQAATTTETYDAFGRLIKIDEPDSVSSTSYLHDAAGRLTSVTMTDTATSTTQPSRTFTYDGRGFLLAETHPENGTTTYGSYDARGHVGQKVSGASGSSTEFDLQYSYDAAERLTNIDQLHPPSGSSARLLKQFTFATANGTTADNNTDYRKGKLAMAMRRNYSPAGTIDVTETYEYGDAAGRLTAKTTDVDGLQKFTQSYTFNDLSLPATVNYPTCPDVANHPCATASSMIGSIAPTYDTGLLKTVPSFATDIAYDLNGMVTKIDHPGGISDTMSVDTTTALARPKEIKFESYDPCTGPQVTLPAAKQVNSGSTPGLQVTVIGSPTPTLTYQWFKDGTLIAGETSSSCCADAATTATYMARVFNSCGKSDASTAVTVCGNPSIGTQPQSSTYNGSPITLTVSGNGCSPFTYQWYVGDSGVTSSPITGATSSSYTVTSLPTTTHYWARVTDSNGGAVNSNTAIITTAACTPHIDQQPANQSVAFGALVSNVHAVVSGCEGYRIFTWYRGVKGDTSNGFYSNLGGTTLDTFAAYETISVWLRISGDTINTVDSEAAIITVTRPAPTGVNAVLASNTTNQINVTWQSVPFSDHYLLRRCWNGGCDVPFAVSDLNYPDTNRALDKTYIYSVASVDHYGTMSAYSVPDLATTMSFSTIQSNTATTTVAFDHFDQIRIAINDIQTAKNTPNSNWRQMLDASGYLSVAVPAPGGPILAAHLVSLRNAMNAALSVAGVPTPAYTDNVTSGTPIKAIHITELQLRAK
jgi:YD repeat-containing protein